MQRPEVDFECRSRSVSGQFHEYLLRRILEGVETMEGCEVFEVEVPDYLAPISVLPVLVLSGYVRDIRRGPAFVTYSDDDWGNGHLQSPISKSAASLPV
jgi:hypothetical protein